MTLRERIAKAYDESVAVRFLVLIIMLVLNAIGITVIMLLGLPVWLSVTLAMVQVATLSVLFSILVVP